MAEAREAWDEFGDALRTFGDAARRLGDAVSGVVRDPEFVDKSQRLAMSLGAAITATIDQVSKEVSDALSRAAERGRGDSSSD